MHDNTTADWLNKTIVRGFIGRFIDGIVYWLLGLTYQIFINVASAELFTNETVKNFFGRVQLILGVFMIFKLAVSIIKGIVNPDTFTDKNNGMGNIVYRIIFTLVMLTIVVPINIPNPQNEYEIQLNNNGLLFGTLYSFQNRILENNTLGRLILGTTDGMESTDSDGKSNLEKAGDLLTATILKGFIRINVKEDGLDEKNSSNWLCPDKITDDVLKAYTDLTADTSTLLSLTSLTCEAELNDQNWLQKLWSSIWNTNEVFVFAYKPLISAIVGGIFVYLLINFTIDVAVRAVKLAVLRLIAPIPIISYMDPNGQKKMFDSWVKQITSTYLDLFIRLAIVYFVIFLIQDMIVNGIVVNNASGAVGVFTYIFIFLGLFVFAKQAPKFFKDLFGLKDGGGKLFGGLGEALGIAGGVGAATVGSIGSFAAGMRASKMADQTRQSMGEKDIFGRDVNPNSILNKGKHLLAGFAGGAGGLGTGMKTAFTAKDHATRSTFEAMQKQNAQKLAAGDAGSTLFGRMGATASRAFTGEAPGAEMARNIASMESRRKALDAVKKRVSGEMVKNTKTSGLLYKNNTGLDLNGNAIGEVNYKSFMAAKNAAMSAGRDEFEFKNAAGATMKISMQEANMQEGYLLKTNESSYLERVVDGYETDTTLSNLIDDAVKKGGVYDIDLTTGEVIRGSKGRLRTRDSVTKTMDDLDIQVVSEKRRNTINEANDRFSGGKK